MIWKVFENPTWKMPTITKDHFRDWNNSLLPKDHFLIGFGHPGFMSKHLQPNLKPMLPMLPCRLCGTRRCRACHFWSTRRFWPLWYRGLSHGKDRCLQQTESAMQEDCRCQVLIILSFLCALIFVGPRTPCPPEWPEFYFELLFGVSDIMNHFLMNLVELPVIWYNSV